MRSLIAASVAEPAGGQCGARSPRSLASRAVGAGRSRRCSQRVGSASAAHPRKGPVASASTSRTRTRRCRRPDWPAPLTGRGVPRWSVTSQAPLPLPGLAGLPASIAGLPASSAIVWVGPPLLASGPSLRVLVGDVAGQRAADLAAVGALDEVVAGRQQLAEAVRSPCRQVAVAGDDRVGDRQRRRLLVGDAAAGWPAISHRPCCRRW